MQYRALIAVNMLQLMNTQWMRWAGCMTQIPTLQFRMKTLSMQSILVSIFKSMSIVWQGISWYVLPGYTDKQLSSSFFIADFAAPDSTRCKHDQALLIHLQ